HAWVGVESFFLALTGTTPGKWLFGLSVKHCNGSRLTFGQAFWRAVMVFLQGLGCGLLAPFAMPWAFWRIANDGITPWDRDCSSVVNYRPHYLRTAIGLAVLAAARLLTM